MNACHDEFPHFESDIPPVFLSSPWEDHSWRNDACPSFVRPFADGREIHVFVDEVDPSKRWEAPNCARFTVYTTDAEGSFDSDEPCFGSDSLAAALDHVAFLVGEGMALLEAAEPLRQCDCCGKMRVCADVVAYGLDTTACEECSQ